MAETTGVVVYGDTWAAINAACAAAIRGATVALVAPYINLGGIISNGLSAIDYGRYGTHGIGWLTDEFHKRQSAMYGYNAILTRTTPSTAEYIFTEMLKFYGVRIRVGSGKTLSSVAKSGASITSITTTDGTVFNGTNFIDGSEEGDLAKMAGVTMVTGRESSAQYGESLAGFFPDETNFVPLDTYLSPGVLLNGFSAYPVLSPGDADLAVQAYTFRLCLTANKRLKRNWPKPSGYDETLFEYRRRQIPTSPSYKPFSVVPCLDTKGDMNGDFGVPRQWSWPESTPTQRAAILQQVFNEQAGWLWFLANDSSIDPQVQDYVNSYGIPTDEFTYIGNTTLGWPKQLYVREGRRMVGQYVMTQADMQTNVTKTDNIAVGFYSFDVHLTQRLAVVRSGIPGFIEDDMNSAVAERQTVPYHIPFTCMLPLILECDNLIVPVAASTSHVANGSYRIDIHKANAGSAAGLAAGKSVVIASPINSLNIVTLQSELDTYGQVRSYTPPA